MQRALCLESMGLHVQALAVAKEVARMAPSKVMPCLLAARICYQHLNNVGNLDNVMLDIFDKFFFAYSYIN